MLHDWRGGLATLKILPYFEIAKGCRRPCLSIFAREHPVSRAVLKLQVRSHLNTWQLGVRLAQGVKWAWLLEKSVFWCGERKQNGSFWICRRKTYWVIWLRLWSSLLAYERIHACKVHNRCAATTENDLSGEGEVRSDGREAHSPRCGIDGGRALGCTASAQPCCSRRRGNAARGWAQWTARAARRWWCRYQTPASTCFSGWSCCRPRCWSPRPRLQQELEFSSRRRTGPAETRSLLKSSSATCSCCWHFLLHYVMEFAQFMSSLSVIIWKCN